MNLFLLIAYYLALLSFYLGVLIYSLPIPITGLKRWGPRLLSDAFFVATLVVGFDLIIEFANYLLQLLGASWPIFTATIAMAAGSELFLLSILSEISSFIYKAMPTIASLINILSSKIVYSLYILLFMYTLALFIKYGHYLIASLGVALMAIPFRIARGAGALLFAFSLVFYVGLPLYPWFYSTFVAAPLIHEAPGAILDGRVVNMFGSPIMSGKLILLESNSSKYMVLAQVANGKFYTVIRNLSILMSSRLRPALLVNGIAFYTNVTSIPQACMHYLLYPFLCTLNLEVKGLLLYRENVAVFVKPKPSLFRLSTVNSTLIAFNIACTNECQLYISTKNPTELVSICIDNKCLKDLNKLCIGEWSLGKERGYIFRIHIHGLHKVRIYITKAVSFNLVKLFISIANYIVFTAKVFGLTFLLIMLMSYAALISSIVYLSVLITITIGLARLLGGWFRGRFIP